MKSRLVLIVEATLLAGALALAAPAVAGAASPAKGGHGSTTTTTTTKPGSSSGSAGAFATLVIKPASIGHVAVEQAGTTTFTPGTNNEQLHVGDTIQTDTVGLAEIDYATNAYTRLDVNTTFTIKKLTDNQGNRQIDGGLTSGETWNRTAELTQSESFQQDGGGVTAAVSGTAFVVDCTTSTAVPVHRGDRQHQPDRLERSDRDPQPAHAVRHPERRALRVADDAHARSARADPVDPVQRAP